MAQPNDRLDQPIAKDIEHFAAAAEEIRHRRRLRREFLPAMHFAEPGWDLLLYVFAGTAAGTPAPLRDVALELDLSLDTARRWASAVEDAGMIELTQRQPGAEHCVKMSQRGLDQMVDYLSALGAGSALFFAK